MRPHFLLIDPAPVFDDPSKPEFLPATETPEKLLFDKTRYSEKLFFEIIFEDALQNVYSFFYKKNVFSKRVPIEIMLPHLGACIIT